VQKEKEREEEVRAQKEKEESVEKENAKKKEVAEIVATADDEKKTQQEENEKADKDTRKRQEDTDSEKEKSENTKNNMTLSIVPGIISSMDTVMRSGSSVPEAGSVVSRNRDRHRRSIFSSNNTPIPMEGENDNEMFATVADVSSLPLTRVSHEPLTPDTSSDVLNEADTGNEGTSAVSVSRKCLSDFSHNDDDCFYYFQCRYIFVFTLARMTISFHRFTHRTAPPARRRLLCRV